MFKKIIHVYDKPGHINVTDLPFDKQFVADFSPDANPPQVFYSGFGHHQKVHSIAKTSDIDFENNKDTIYTYMVEPFGNFNWFLGHKVVFTKNEFVRHKAFIFQIPQQIVKMLQEIPNFYLCIQTKHEATYTNQDLILIHRQLKKSKIPVNKVILSIVENWGIGDMYNRIIKEKLYDNKMIIHPFPSFLLEKGWEMIQDKELGGLQYYDEVDIDKLLTEKRTHKMLYYNRRVRKDHRITLLLHMMRDGMFKDNLVSYNLEMAEEVHHWPRLTYDAFKMRQGWTSNFTQDDWNEWYPKFFKSTKSIIDNSNFDTLGGFRAEHIETYKKAYVSIVSESDFYAKHKYLSEKVYKCFNHLHPFVIVGSRGSIKKLKEQGFKTWDKWWDESYDDIDDSDERYKKVYEIIKFINSKTLDELHQMYQEMIPNLIFNQDKMKYVGENYKELYKVYYDENLIGAVNENL
tara:strand:- start:1761 stop:3140 length:1380 start_codon:yes stop_codon:yes gene_type:complete